jgi:pantetheine-phosphate adenylyltransferase
MKRAVFPGSFDPFTKGHECIVEKAKELFDEVIVGVGHNTSKQSFYTVESRVEHIESIFKNDQNVKVASFKGLTVEFCKQINAQYIVRGLRDSKDFGYERSIAQMNLEISDVESVFFMTVPEYTAINSSIVREIVKSGGKVDKFVTNENVLVTN